MEPRAGEPVVESTGAGTGQSKVLFKRTVCPTLLKQEVAFCPEYVEIDLWTV